jgi:hypothetical protein
LYVHQVKQTELPSLVIEKQVNVGIPSLTTCAGQQWAAGRPFQTAGINALPLADQSAICEKVETFNAFSPDPSFRRVPKRQLIVL